MDNYKQKVVEHVDKSFTTTIIGAIASFENEFKEELQDPEFKQRFQKVRSQILDSGNDKRRNVLAVLSRGKIEKHEYQYNFSKSKDMTLNTEYQEDTSSEIVLSDGPDWSQKTLNKVYRRNDE